MAYLNRQEREALLNELKDMKINKARGKLRRMDKKGSVAYYRNAQMSGKLYTRYRLEGMGTQVTLVEVLQPPPPNASYKNPYKAKYEFVEVIVEPTPENRT
jgi:hypothetical protein